VVITEANLNLRQTELRLDSEREELHQLEKMYKADDLTENTEEIILKRQRESVKFAEVAVEHANLTHKRTLELTIPREAIELERAAQAAAIALKENEQNLPRNLEIKRLALEDARVTAKRTADDLAKLEEYFTSIRDVEQSIATDLASGSNSTALITAFISPRTPLPLFANAALTRPTYAGLGFDVTSR
jgi:hypothetical protein